MVEATLREMGVSFDFATGENHRPWVCDLLPQIFKPEEWKIIESGMRQRMQAFDLFLQDVYGRKEILRAGIIPIHPVLGSRNYENAAVDLPRPQGSYLHLSGLCITRDERGRLAVKHHHFSHASGISYMMQNRRALARITPEIFQDVSLYSLADAPQAIVEKNCAETADRPLRDPPVVLLSPGIGSAIYSEHSFLARRMGIPLVQGGDLLVLDDCVYLKTVQGLERIEVIYSRMADSWLDPLVFRRNSRLGIPGLVHCLRKGTVTVVNGIGSQLADDRALLCFAQKNHPVLPRRRSPDHSPRSPPTGSRRHRPDGNGAGEPGGLSNPLRVGLRNLQRRLRRKTRARGRRIHPPGNPAQPGAIHRATHLRGRRDDLLRERETG